MLRLTLAQMRRSAGRLAAAGVAIAISTAFVAATLLAGNLIHTATTDEFAARFADADLVVSTTDGSGLTAKDVTAIRGTEGVAAADPLVESYYDVRANGKAISQLVLPTASDPRLEAQRVATGAFPAAPGQVALPTSVAERLGLHVGDSLTLERPRTTAKDTTTVTETLHVTGTLDDPYRAYTKYGGAAVVDAGQLATWTAQADGTASDDTTYEDVLVATRGSVPDVRSALEAAPLPRTAVFQTKSEVARDRAAEATGGQDVFTTVVLSFAAVALLVAALVIANTFQVLVAQRARTLALLRCVGALKGQLARSVLVEAGLLGVGASILGIALGAGLGQVALSVARPRTSLPLPSTIEVTPAVVLVPLVVGAIVTVVAGLAPARAATRVAPLEAMRPTDAPTLTAGAGLARGMLALLLVVGGGALLGLGVLLGLDHQPGLALAAGIAGGAASFVGILVGAVFWMPRVVHVAGRLVGGGGASSRLAAANTLRNPRRTTATATALLIGVTLVAMMSTGAACARTTLTSTLDATFPVDVEVGFDGYTGDVAPSLPPTVTAQLAHLSGVADAVTVTGVQATVGRTASGDITTVHGLDPAQAAKVLRDPSLVARMRDGTIMIPEEIAKLDPDHIITTGDVVTVQQAGTDGKAGKPVRLTARVADITDFASYVTPATMRSIAPDAPVSATWLRIADHADTSRTVTSIQDTASGSGLSLHVVGPATDRASTQEVIDTILRIVLGLLAVAVVIALIGVANTLSLSVLERRRESATLRAIGLTRSQLRWMLAQEGMLIAGVGAVTGIVLGVGYGWAGATSALSSTGTMHLAVPWRDLGIVLVVALAAGLVASVVPGRSAARTPPVAALAID